MLKAPNAMSFRSPNLAEAWRRWEQQFTMYHRAAELAKKPEATQTAILLNIAGPEALDIYHTFTFAEGEDANTMATVLGKFKAYCQPHRNTVFERHRFWTREQEEDEPIDQWLTDLRTRAESCEFGDQRDLLIRDKIIFGIRDARVKERLLREPNLELPKAVDICRAAEATKFQVQAMAKEAVTEAPAAQVHAFTDRRAGREETATRVAEDRSAKSPSKASAKAPCKYCGERHPPRRCPAYGKTCKRCQKENHVAKVCRSMPRGKEVNALLYEREDASTTDSEDSELYLAPLFIGKVSDSSEWTELIDVAGTQVSFKLDTGANANVLPYTTYRKIATPLRPTGSVLTGIGHGQVRPRGKNNNNNART